jgi:hypothetical protein
MTLGRLRKIREYNIKIGLTRGRPGAWETDLVHFIINGNIN